MQSQYIALVPEWFRIALLICLLALADVTLVAAEGNATIRYPSKAEELFVRGKERLAATDYGAACALLSESYALDPATGSLLALALCHERQGRLASALHDYEQVVTRSRSEKRADRAQAAEAQIVSLQDRISTVSLLVEPNSADLAIRINDVLVARQDWSRPVPTDGGFIVVTAQAPGRPVWSQHLKIAESGEALKITVPTLAAPSAPSVAEAPKAFSALRVAERRATKSRPRFSVGEVSGFTLMAASAVGASLAVGYTLSALAKNRKSDKSCDGDMCSPAGRQLREDSRKAGNIATITVLATTTLATAGLITYLVGRKRRQEGPREERLRAAAWITPQVAGAAMSGNF